MEESHIQEQRSHKKKPISDKVYSFLKNKYNLAFLIVLFLGIFIRLKYFYMESIWNDAAQQLWNAMKVIHNPSFLFSQEFLAGDYTLLNILKVLIYPFTRDVFLSSKIVDLLFDVIGITAIYLLGIELKNRFTGLVSAILFASNHLFWFIGLRMLADAPLASMFILSAYFVTKLGKKRTLSLGITTGLVVIISIFIKKQAILILVSLLLYYIIFKRKEMFKDKSLLISWLIPVSFILTAALLGFIIFNANFLGSFFITMFRFTSASELDAVKTLPFVLSPYLLPLFVLGVIFCILYKIKNSAFILISFFVYLLFFELNVLALPRYLLPLLPFGILISVFAIDEVGDFIKMFLTKYVRWAVVIIFLLLVVRHNYSEGTSLIVSKSYSYTGYQEAGEWLKTNVAEDDIVFAGSPRPIRTFFGREYAGPGSWDKGGKSLWYLRAEEYLNNKTLFEKDLIRLSKEHEVYLEIDIWEYTQPSWYYPITEESFNYFIDLGFKPIHVINRQVPTSEGLKDTSVIFIFKYEVQDNYSLY